MITRKDLIVSVLCTFCLATVLFTMMPVQSAEWDPWLDVKEDGRINVLDLIKTAGALGTFGDTTRNVNVTNWPVSKQQTVFYYENETTDSGWYNASGGFGHMQLIWKAIESGSEYCLIGLVSRIYDPSGTGSNSIMVQKLNVTTANAQGMVSFPVPSEMFYFSLYIHPAMTVKVYLAFYLTYA